MARKIVAVRRDGQIIAEYPITLGALNFAITDADYIKTARETLIEDRLAKDEADTNNFVFQIRGE